MTEVKEDGDTNNMESDEMMNLQENKIWRNICGLEAKAGAGGPQQSPALRLGGYSLRKKCSLFPDVPSPDSEHPVTAVGPAGECAPRLEKARLYKSRVVLYGVIVNSVHIAS